MEEYKEETEEEVKVKSRSRDDYFRCKTCKHLWSDRECVIDPIKGNICPKESEKQYDQPEYELPIQN